MMAYVFRARDLPKLDLQVDRGSDFKAWRAQWNAYMSLSGLKGQEVAKQRVHEPLRTGRPRNGKASLGADPVLFA